ncbi:MAG TPA: alkaline phosphatase family protein, partial [Thermodesulfobacteriota bacterium]|nr:alkaline phosphatase family protein [Thermodesulfobacteriota bacterium]
GSLPSFQKILGGDDECKANTVFFDRATTIFPSVTLVGHASIFTGVYPGQHGIAGNQWFDRVGDAFKPNFIPNNPFDYMHVCPQLCIYATQPPLTSEMKEVVFLECRSLHSKQNELLSCTEPSPAGLVNKHLKAQTIYEAAGEAGKSSTVIFSQYWKGVPEDKVVHPDQDEQYLYGLTETKFLPKSENFGEFDRGMMLHAINKVRSEGIPDILTVYFSGLDATGHMLGIHSHAEYLSKSIDPPVGGLLIELKKQDKNWCKDTLFVVTADHGQKHIDPTNEASLSLVKSTLNKAGFKNNYVVAVNGGMAHVYLKNGSTLNWPDPPRFDKDVIPAAEALCGAMDERQLWKILVRGPDGNYKVYRADRKKGKGKKEVCETAGIVELTGDQELKSGEGLNVIDLINGLNSKRSGDILILLMSSSYFEHREIFKWGNKADHGSLHEGGLRVPIVLAGGGVSLNPEGCKHINAKNRCDDVVRTVNIVRTIARYLGFEDKLKEAEGALPVKFLE